MGGRAQRDWRHCVPKETEPSGPRISINFAPEPVALELRKYVMQARGGDIHLIERLHGSEDFVLGPGVRGWLDDDEYLIRRRIGRDLEAVLAGVA